MHFDSSALSAGATAVLESRILYPKRGFQCLQFYLYNSGSAGDQLNIYIREYAAGAQNGTVILVEEIKGTVSASSLCGSEGGDPHAAQCTTCKRAGAGVMAVLWEGRDEDPLCDPVRLT